MREIRIPGIRRVLRVSWSDEATRRDVDDEIEFHLERRTAELVQLGASHQHARERAEAEFGDLGRSRRELIAVDRRRMGHEKREDLLMSFLEDLRYALRGLLRRPALLVVTTLALSIGIAANATMFGVVDQLLLRPPAHVVAPDGVKRVYFRHVDDGKTSHQSVTTYPVLAALQRMPEWDLSVFNRSAFTLGSGPDARKVDALLVSGNYFGLLGVRPQLGRAFTPGEDRIPQGDPVAVISDRFWKRSLGSAPDALGRTLRLNGHPFTIVGIAPKGFSGIDAHNVDLWVPVSAMAPYLGDSTWHSQAMWWWVESIARVRPGVAPATASAAATVAYRNEVKSWNRPWQDTAGTIVLGSLVGARQPDGLSADGKVSLWLMGVSAIVLIIACANVANLLVARTLQRRREIAVRMALGVSRSRLMRMLLTEAALLAAISGVVALAIAFAASRLVQGVLLPGIVFSDSVIDMRVLAFTLVVAVLCILLAGLAPAVHGIGTRVSEGLKASSRQIAEGGAGLRQALLVLQAALSIVLLIGAGLFVSSLRNVIGRDVGIDLGRVLLVDMDLQRAGFTAPQREELFRIGHERLARIPGVNRASIVRQSVPSRFGSGISLKVPGIEKKPELSGGGPYYSVVGSDYFVTMGTSMLRGRNFTEAEARVANRSLIVNKIVADAYWPGVDPIGRCARLGSDTTCSTVVGVVENMMLFSLVRDDRAMLYVPPAHASFGGKPPAAIVVRASADAQPLIPLVQKEMQALSPNMPFVLVEPYSERVAHQVRPWRLGATMFTLFGVIAVVIAAVGLYSVMAYWVSQRTHEIGVRMALGAQRRDVVRLVAWQASRAIVAGLALGALAAAIASRWVTDLLYETSPRDPAIYAMATVVLLASAIIASIVPTRRSTAVDPAQAIRAD